MKNQGFIRLFQQWGQEAGIRFQWVAVQEYENRHLPDLALNRTRRPQVSRYYEERGIPVFHSSQLTRLGNDKYQTIAYLQEHLSEGYRWQLPRTMRLSAQQMEGLLAGEEPLPWQGVIKSVDGHGGTQVFLTGQEDRWKKALAGKACILQERIESDSQDLRIYVLGGEIYQAVLRTGSKDFRSNYSLGGTAQAVALSPEEEQNVWEYIRCFGKKELSLVGLDFIRRKDGRLIFNELEEMAGTRMLYQCSNRDIVRDYVAWLAKAAGTAGLS